MLQDMFVCSNVLLVRLHSIVLNPVYLHCAALIANNVDRKKQALRSSVFSLFSFVALT